MSNQIVTANRLTDGRVVYLTADAGWSENLADSRFADTDQEAEALLSLAKKDADANIVLDPYLIDVTVNGASPEPVQFREQIRANGPTVPAGIPAESPLRKVA